MNKNSRRITTYDKLKLYCGNCGRMGHTYKKCADAIISLGIILYNNIQVNNYYEIKFLLIQRRDSIGFIELIRGKYPEDDETYLIKLIDNMTNSERTNALSLDFDELLAKSVINVALNKNSRYFKYEYNEAKDRFNRIRDSGILERIIDSSKTHWDEPEWGFPKGRRQLKEKDNECARREFEEETGFIEDDYLVLENVKPLEESFVGSNNIRYKHSYFLAKSCNQKLPVICKSNKIQMVEIGDIGWFTFQEALKKIRPYQKEKINVLKKAYSIIRAEKTYFKEHLIEDDPTIVIN
jgi:8-oxo-dGTP pyrophosphatase MutT (NUDIX family)